MRVEGEREFAAPREVLWDVMNDPRAPCRQPASPTERSARREPAPARGA
jgi:hypothetical protein